MIEAEQQVASGAASPEVLTSLVIRQVEELKRSTELMEKALAVEETVDPLLKLVAKTLFPPLLETIETDPCHAFSTILSYEIGEAEKKVKSAWGALNLYHAQHKTEDLKASREALSLLRVKTALINSLPGRCGLTFRFKEQFLMERIDSSVKRIALQIEGPSPHDAAELLRNVDRGVEEGMPNEEEKKKAFLAILDAGISRLPSSWQNRLDGWVYHYSPSPKGGANWGRINRLKNLEVLQGALMTTMRDEIVELLATQHKISSPEERALFYRALHSMASGPKTPDPISWSNAQLPYLFGLIDQTAEALKNPEQFIELYHVDQPDPEVLEVINGADSEDLKKVRQLDGELRKIYTLAQLKQKEPPVEETRELIKKALSTETKRRLKGLLSEVKAPPQECEVSWGSVPCSAGLRHLLNGIGLLKLELSIKRV